MSRPGPRLQVSSPPPHALPKSAEGDKQARSPQGRQQVLRNLPQWAHHPLPPPEKVSTAPLVIRPLGHQGDMAVKTSLMTTIGTPPPRLWTSLR